MIVLIEAISKQPKKSLRVIPMAIGRTKQSIDIQ